MPRSSHASSGWESEILKQLDKYYEDLEFPLPRNANYPMADVRLTAFRNQSEWLIVFEVIAAAISQGWFQDMIFAYGNRVKAPGLLTAENVVQAAPGYPIRDADGRFILNLDHFEVLIRGQKRDFSPSKEDFRKAGLQSQGKMPGPIYFLRLLVSLCPGDLFLPKEELLKRIRKSELQTFMQLDDWHHPDLAADEPPSRNSCFQSLASALAKDDPDLYSCSPTKFNTQWTDWEVDWP
jgi:uncharacterized protein DUF7003